MIIPIDNTYSSIVTEAYYGKSKELVQIEKLLVPIINAINAEYDIRNKDESKALINGKEINQSKQLKNIETLFSKALNIGDVEITFYGAQVQLDLTQPVQRPNAYNIPSIMTNIKSLTKKGSVTTKDIDMKIFVDKGLIYNYKTTPGEVVALLLHEAGHSLDRSVFHALSSLLPSTGDIYDILTNAKTDTEATQSIIGYFVGVGLRPFIGELMRNSMGPYYEFIEDVKSRVPFVNKTLNVLLITVQQAITVLNNIRRVLNLVTRNSRLNLTYLAAHILDAHSIFGYGGEKFADSVATTYGYGVEIASINRKFDESRSGFATFDYKKMPVVNVVMDFSKVTLGSIYMLCDEHPNASIRVYSQLKKLRKELNDPSIPKELKKEIESQIPRLEKMCEEMSSIRANAERGMIFTAIWNKTMMQAFKGYGDPREILELIWKHEM